MRQLWMALVMGPLVPLSACQSSRADTEPSLPTVSFAYNEDREYAEVLEEADAFCEQEYDKDAVLLSRGPVDGFYEAVFTCR
jgi:hypothetical protein